MKNLLLNFLSAMALVAVVACSESNDDFSYNGDGIMPSGGGGSSSLSGELATFDVAIDKTSLSESETVPSDDEDYIENNTFGSTIKVTFNNSTAVVEGSVDGVSVDVDGNDVVVTSTVKGVNYELTGSTSDGMFKIYSSKKYQLTLNGVSITNSDGPAINSQSGKRAYVVVADGTTNTLTDGTSYTTSYSPDDATVEEDQKAALFSEGELLFSGKGQLDVYGNTKNGIASDDYIKFRPGNNVYVKATAGHGIKANDSIIVKGGVINVEVSSTAAKGMKCDSLLAIQGGRTTCITTGGAEYDSDEDDVSCASCIKTDSVFSITGGALYCKSTGAGGKGIKVDHEGNFLGGTVRVITTGNTYVYNSSQTGNAKGVKVDGDLTIDGCDLMIRATGSGQGSSISGSEGLESKAEMTINSGSVQVYAYDDAINSAGNMYIKGGNIVAISSSNDGIDANGNMYFQGGTTVAYGAGGAEGGIDANEEENYYVYFQGGNVFAIGGGNASPRNSSSTQGYVTTTGSVSAGSAATIKSGSTTLASFSLPASYSNGSILVSAEGMSAGSTYTLSFGSTSVSLTASQYGSGGMGGMPEMGGMGGRP